MSIRFRRPILALLGALIPLGLRPPTLPAQVVPARTGVGAAFEVYRFADPDAVGIESLSLLSLPFAAVVPLPAALRLEVSGAYARASLVRQDGSDSQIAGLTDTRVGLRIPVRGDLASVAAFAVLPTGKTTPTREEAEVAGAVASDLLPLAISHWGSGGGAGLAFTLAQSFGELGVGVGVSYLVSREFDPLESSGLASYRAGDQLAVQLAMDHTVGSSGKATLQLQLQRQEEDELAGDNLFRAGNRMQAIGSYAFRAGRTSSGVVYGGAQHRERGAALLDITRDTPSQDLFLVGGGLRVPIGTGMVVLPSANGRIYRTDDGIGQGYLGGLGAALEISTGGTRITPGVRGHVGNVLIREGTESRVVGLDLSVAVSLGGGR